MKTLFRDIEREKLAWVCVHGKDMENQAESPFREKHFPTPAFLIPGNDQGKTHVGFLGILMRPLLRECSFFGESKAQTRRQKTTVSAYTFNGLSK
jgi:hypothetical protein